MNINYTCIEETARTDAADKGRPVSKRRILPFILTAWLAMPSLAIAQHEGHQQNQPHDTTQHMQHLMGEGMNMQHGNMQMPMSHAFSRNLPMSRNASGTGWLPDAPPMYGNMFHSGD